MEHVQEWPHVQLSTSDINIPTCGVFIDTAKENVVFVETASETPFAKLATFSVDPGILISLIYASAYHPYTILATGEWMISWLGPISRVH